MKHLFFHSWVYVDRELRQCSICNLQEGFSAEKGKWMDIGYLEGTNLDGGYWTRTMLNNFRKFEHATE